MPPRWGCAHSGVQAALSLERFLLISSKTKHMFPSRPPSHLPLGIERMSAQFLAGSADRRPSAPEVPGLGKHSQALPPTAGPAGPGRLCGSPGPQAPSGSLSTPTWPRLAAPTGMASRKSRKEEQGAGVGAGHRTRPTSQVTSLNPSLLGPGSLPPPTGSPLPTLTHVKPSATLAPLAGTTACDSAPSPEAALWVAAPETLVGRVLSWGAGVRAGGRRHVQTPGGLSLSTNPGPHCLHPVLKAQTLQQRCFLKRNGLVKMYLIQFLFSLGDPPPVLQALTGGQIGTCFSSVFHPHLMCHPQPLAASGIEYSRPCVDKFPPRC